MPIPSLDSFVSKAIFTFKRFPLAITAAFIATFYLIQLTALNYSAEKKEAYGNVVMTAYLAMLLFVAVSLFAERKMFGRAKTYLLNTAALILVASYFFSLSQHFMYISLLRFYLFTLGLHFLIAFIPFYQSGNINGFWQFNKTLFIRILTAGLYTLVLYAGLALAILAIEKLFNADVGNRIYSNLWFILTGIFNTWFFLAGIPIDYEQLEERGDYPKGLKIFTQYVLVPLITLYLAILYAYTFKIIFSAQWPQGWVSYLVLGFSIGGILSLLLIYPVRNEQQNRWMLTFSRFFYLAILPLVVLLFFAIKRRITDYGITEERYFVLLLALWLLFISLYFLLSKNKNIKLVPVSLCIICFLASFGPWSAFDVSKRSQRNKLLSVLQRNHMLENGKIVRSAAQIPFKDNSQITSIVEYITKVHGYNYLQPYFSSNLDTLLQNSNNDYDQSRILLEEMNINYLDQYNDSVTSGESPGIYFNYSVSDNDPSAAKIQGFEYYISGVNLYAGSGNCNSLKLDSAAIKLCIDPVSPKLSVSANSDILTVDLSAFVDSLKTGDHNKLTSERMSIFAGNKGLSAKIIISSISGRRKRGETIISQVTADVFIKIIK